MDANELRALADAPEPMAQLERYGSPGALALESTIAYMRACADGKPVAWMALAYGLPSQATTDEPTAIRWRKAGGDVVPLYTHPAPQPQAEPIDPHMIVAEDRFPDAQAEPSEFKFQPRAGALARSWDRADALAEPKEENNVWKQIIPDDVPQAEPKREPLSDERIAEIQRAAYERAAQECESRATAPQGEDYLACYYACAAAIRALGGSDGN